ncbi:MAG: hypothetical protein MUF03_09265 [Rubrivivax sp.]|jgi:hypothetical protein|nr:hypothetical protein [Rubrivivax sp.]
MSRTPTNPQAAPQPDDAAGADAGPTELDPAELGLVGGGLPKGTWASRSTSLPKGTWSATDGRGAETDLPKGTW